MKQILISLAIFAAVSCSDTSSDHTADNATANANSHSVDHSKMGHAQQKESSPGAEKAPLGLQFIDTMIVHHQGAIEMSQLAPSRAEDTAVKKFAAGVIADQDREVTEMKRWRKDWFGDAAPAINMGMPGMQMSGDKNMKDLSGLAGNEFDLEYIGQMIPHHQGAVEMSRAFLANPASSSAKAELRDLAETIIKAQESEISLLKEWQKRLSK